MNIGDTVLWHYTSIDSFIKILDDRILASHYQFLNDSAEIEYGRKLFDDELRNYNIFADYIEDIIEDSNAMDVYLACFSTAEDSLEQWRAYAPMSGGVAIGFSGKKILEEMEKEKEILCQGRRSFRKKLGDHKVALSHIFYYLRNKINLPFIEVGQCVYDIKNLKSYIIKKLNEYQDELKNNCSFFYNKKEIRIVKKEECTEEAFKHNIIMKLGWLRNFTACCAKHYTFENEKEVRVIYYGRNLRDLTKIVGNIPRFDTFLLTSRGLIDEIIISPHGDSKRIRLLTEFLKEKYTIIRNVKIRESAIPYIGKN